MLLRFFDWLFGIRPDDGEYNYYHSHLDDLR